MCNTQLGLREPGSLQDRVHLVFGHQVPYWNGHPLPFSPSVARQSETRDVTSKGSLVGWHSAFVWMQVLAECLYRHVYCLIIVLPFPFSMVR